MPETDVRRHLLKPLRSRKYRAIGASTYLEALARLDERALGDELVKQLRSALTPKQHGESKPSWKNAARAKDFVELAKALYASRRISTQEYVFYASNPVENVHSARWLDGYYDAELGPINVALDDIKKKYGLRPEEDWRRGEGPDEYVRLEDEYEKVVDGKLVETLKEFGLEDLAELSSKNAKEFDRLRERGRRTIFHSSELALAIRDVVLRYEEEARQAANASAYSAAIICIGAAIEGLLLLRCLRSKKKAKDISLKLPRRVRPKLIDDPTTWTFEALIEVCLNAGWLPPVETPLARYNVAALAHTLRLMRNYVHPGREARERPWSEADERDYQDASAIYVILFSRLGKISVGKATDDPVAKR
jgi:hypothetical protein